jgi:pteridine reductase
MSDTSNIPREKTALITGAARRIGAKLVRALHGVGMNIILHYRGSAQHAKQLYDELNGQRADSIMLVRADLMNTEELGSLVSQAQNNAWGRLDVLINNASTFYPTCVGEITEQDWETLSGINLKAPLFLSQAVAPFLRQSHGCIINIVDIHADRPLKNYTVYCIAKAGLVMLTKSMARELAPEVRVNGIAPGAILWPEFEDYGSVHTDIIERTALKREGDPEDIANAALFLILNADYITGQIISIDGGRSLSN